MRKTEILGRLAVTATMVLLFAACPNELSRQIAEDVLVANAGGRPDIARQVPEPGATDVLSDVSIEIEFTMDLAADAVDYISLSEGTTNGDTVAGTASYNAETRTLVFDPTTPLTVDTRYAVSVSGDLKNAGGARYDQDTSWTFETTAVNPDQFRFDLDLSDMDVDLSTYRTYLAVTPLSSAADSPLGYNTIIDGGLGDEQSFLIDADDLSVTADDKLVVFVFIMETELVEDSGAAYGITWADSSADIFGWFGYKGSTGETYPAFGQVGGAVVDYGAPFGFSRAHSSEDAGLAALTDNTLVSDIEFERGVVHTLRPEDAVLRLDHTEIASIATNVSPVAIGGIVGIEDNDTEIEVADRYSITAATRTRAIAMCFLGLIPR